MLAVLLQHPLLAMGFPKAYIQNTISDEASQPATYKKTIVNLNVMYRSGF